MMTQLTPHAKNRLATFQSLEEYQTAEFRRDPKLLREFTYLILQDYLQDRDLMKFKHALGMVVRALGIDRVSKHINVTPASLHRSFSTKGNPSFNVVYEILDMTGVQLSIKGSYNNR